MTLRILIAEGHSGLRCALRALLTVEPDFEIVGEAANSSEMLRLAPSLQPDVLLIDMHLPGLRCFKVMRKLSCLLPATQVVLLTDYEDPDLTLEAAAAGAAACVVSQAAYSALVPAIREASRGQSLIELSSLRRLLDNSVFRPCWSEKGAETLTPDEVDVLRLVARGYTNREAAQELAINTRSLQGRRAKIMAKLGVHSRLELMRYAAARGLLESSTQPEGVPDKAAQNP